MFGLQWAQFGTSVIRATIHNEGYNLVIAASLRLRHRAGRHC